MAVGQGALEDLVEEGRGDSRGSAWFQACSLMKHALARFTRSGTKTRERPRLSAGVERWF